MSMIRLVDTFLCDEFDWLIVLWCNWRGSLAWLFRYVKVGQKTFFEWVVLDAPVLAQFLSDFDRVKRKCLSQAVYINIFQRDFDQTIPFMNSRGVMHAIRWATIYWWNEFCCAFSGFARRLDLTRGKLLYTLLHFIRQSYPLLQSGGFEPNLIAWQWKLFNLVLHGVKFFLLYLLHFT